MLTSGTRLSRATSWGAFHAVRVNKLTETPLWLTVLLHIALTVMGGIVGAVGAVAITSRCAGGLAAPTLEEALIIPGAGFVVGAVWTIGVAIGTRRQFRKFEQKYGKRQPDLPEEEEEAMENPWAETPSDGEQKIDLWDRGQDAAERRAAAEASEPRGERRDLDVEATKRMKRLPTTRVGDGGPESRRDEQMGK